MELPNSGAVDVQVEYQESLVDLQMMRNELNVLAVVRHRFQVSAANTWRLLREHLGVKRHLDR